MAKKKKESILVDDISRQIAETKKILANAQKSLAEKTAEVSDLKARLKQLEKSANDLPEVTRTFTGKWFKAEDGLLSDKNYKQYYYVIKDYGLKVYADGVIYRKLSLFDLNMSLWESNGLSNDIGIYKRIDELFDPKELDSLIPVKPDEIKKETLEKFTGIFKILNDQNILPDEFKPFIAQKKKKLHKR